MTVCRLAMPWATQLRNSMSQPPDTTCSRTQAVPIHFDQWYIVRIEISPENGAVQYYLDGKLIDTYLPDDAEKLLEPETAFTPASVSGSHGPRLASSLTK